MNELRSAGFSAHPSLSHVLNLHLQDNITSRAKFEAKKLADKKGGPNRVAAAGGGN
jgi:hypothetical protein